MSDRTDRTTEDGLEARIASILDLPPEQRPAAFAELRAELPRQAEMLRRCEAAARSLPPAPDGTPAAIAGYELLEVLGEGGMGSVFLAEQTEPIQRRVAIKLIKHGMDTRQVLARFETERQALALMQHENIARVHDAGATADGRPYFVMEFVAGAPVTRYCDSLALSIRERVELFRQVCAGVAHAHQKGVLHRDLKPSNILVASEAERGLPKIIDFGLARATEQDEPQRTMLTEQGQVLGTPEYMSPEQAASTPDAIDTRTDVYSLGVVLYELLSGLLPLDSETLRGAGYFEMLRCIREQDPLRPSTHASTGAGAEQRASARSVDAAGLRRCLEGDLDWITMRCLEKDPRARYATVNELSEDLRRFLDDEPVVASPPSGLYRLKKFLRKRRALVTGAAAFVVALIAGLGIALWQYGVAAANAQEARDNLASYQCRELLQEEHGLWPAVAEKLPAMDLWLRRARALASQADRHRARLQGLRARALPIDPDVAKLIAGLPALRKASREAEDRLARARASENASIHRRLPSIVGAAEDARSHVESAEKEIAARRWRFREYEDQFQHDGLAELVANLGRLADGSGSAIARVTDRRERGATLEARSLRDAAPLWDRAIAAVTAADGEQASERYHDTRLTAQVGLVPVGMDPRSKLWEFAVLDSGSVPERGPDGQLALDAESAIVLVLIPKGRFTMGAQARDAAAPGFDPQAKDGESDESWRVCKVSLDAFFLAKLEMTQAQWTRLMGANASIFPIGTPIGDRTVGPTHPVEGIDYPQTVEALARLRLVLPTEAQWEFAARGGTTTPWWSGTDARELRGVANLADRALQKSGAGGDTWKYDAWLDDGHVVHAPVGSFRANPFGLHDVYGNVWEWCRDYYCNYKFVPRPGDGLRVVPGMTMPARTARGGGWYSVAEFARSASRGAYQPQLQGRFLGVRPARALDTGK